MKNVNNDVTRDAKPPFYTEGGVVKSFLPRPRKYDAYVCYSSSDDYNYVCDEILPELEDKQNFKLFFHDRDFELGEQFFVNIEKAITQSSTAIIIMSQSFVDSDWCNIEFKHCFIESEKDPAFRLLVIMVQPPETLQNVGYYIKNFMAEKTYILHTDPKLFDKIGEYLTKVNPKNTLEDTEVDPGLPVRGAPTSEEGVCKRK